jgi:predicted component of type VI protein secretion system
MLQFVVKSDGPEAGRSVIVRKLPFTIGRGETAGLRISESGVWDLHAELLCNSDGDYVLRPVGDAILLINGGRSEGSPIGPGDEVQMGSAVIEVTLPRAVQKSLPLRETAVWLLAALVVGSQIAAFLLLD